MHYRISTIISIAQSSARAAFLFGIVLLLAPRPSFGQRHEPVATTAHFDAVRSVAFSPNGRHLASGSNDHTIKLWDVATAKARRTLLGHTGRIESVAFSPSGQLLASASDDKSIKLW